MELIKPINASATQERVRLFFKNEWPRLVVMAGTSMTLIKSPSFSSDPKPQNLDNAAETKLVAHIDAKAIVEDVVRTIGNMPQKYGQLLRDRYINELEWIKVSEKMPYTNRDLNRKINIAFLYFADGFKTKNLNVYESEETY